MYYVPANNGGAPAEIGPKTPKGGGGEKVVEMINVMNFGALLLKHWVPILKVFARSARDSFLYTQTPGCIFLFLVNSLLGPRRRKYAD